MAGMLAGSGGINGLGTTALNSAAQTAGANFVNPGVGSEQQRLQSYLPQEPAGISDLVSTQKMLRVPPQFGIMDLMQQQM